MTTYEAGQVAVATVKGQPGVRVMRGASDGPKPLAWATSCAVNGGWWFTDDEVTDVRPLVVLDPEDFGGGAQIAAALRLCPTRNSISLALAEAVEAQIPKPPRIPEPGLWGVVEAGWDSRAESGLPRAEWMHVKGNLWHSTIAGVSARWADLIDPVLIRDGIEDAS